VGRLFESFFRDPWGEPSFGWTAWEPQVDVVDDEKSLTVRAELPGVDPQDVEISVSENVLTIRGEKREESKEKEGAYMRSERFYGSFVREVPLPAGVDPDSASTDYSKGVLSIQFRKEEGKTARRIQVSRGGERGAAGRKVGEVMTRQVECVTPEDTLRAVAERMRSLDLGSFPVCEGDKVVGMITDRDLTVRGIAEGRDAASTPVRGVMSRDVVTCTEDATVEEAERLMKERQIRRLPVVDSEKRLKGYFSIGKMARSAGAEASNDVLKSVTESPRRAAGTRR
jgi:HSP20 family molecular chaperone IbpA/predicted transcriptional regulator